MKRLNLDYELSKRCFAVEPCDADKVLQTEEKDVQEALKKIAKGCYAVVCGDLCEIEYVVFFISGADTCIISLVIKNEKKEYCIIDIRACKIV